MASLEKAKVAAPAKAPESPSPVASLGSRGKQPRRTTGTPDTQLGPLGGTAHGLGRTAEIKAPRDAPKSAAAKGAVSTGAPRGGARLNFDVGNIAIDRGGPSPTPMRSTQPVGVKGLPALREREPAVEAGPSKPIPVEQRGAKPLEQAARTPPAITPVQNEHPPAGAIATPLPDSYAAMFAALGSVGEALHAHALGTASRVGASAKVGPRRVSNEAPSQKNEPHSQDWTAPLAHIIASAGDAVKGASVARAAALAAHAHSEQPEASRFAAEASRVGETLRVAEAYLASVVAGHTFENAQPLRGQSVQFAADALQHRSAAFDSVLARLANGGASAGAGELIDETRLDLAHGSSSIQAGSKPPLLDAERLFEAAQQINDAVEDAARKLHDGAAFTASGAGKDAALAIESRLRRATAATEASGAAAPTATIEPSAPGADSQADVAKVAAELAKAELAREALREKGSDRRRERPAQWEYIVPEATRIVELAAIAATLHVEPVADLRRVLAESIETRHRFVLWLRAGSVMSSALEALVSQGLIETRTLAS